MLAATAWLAMKGKHDRGKAALKSLVGRVADYDVDYEWSVICYEVEESERAVAQSGHVGWGVFRKWTNLQRALISTLAFTYQVGLSMIPGSISSEASSRFNAPSSRQS